MMKRNEVLMIWVMMAVNDVYALIWFCKRGVCLMTAGVQLYGRVMASR